jgi:hypothetical protein
MLLRKLGHCLTKPHHLLGNQYLEQMLLPLQPHSLEAKLLQLEHFSVQLLKRQQANLDHRSK